MKFGWEFQVWDLALDRILTSVRSTLSKKSILKFVEESGFFGIKMAEKIKVNLVRLIWRFVTIWNGIWRVSSGNI